MPALSPLLGSGSACRRASLRATMRSLMCERDVVRRRSGQAGQASLCWAVAWNDDPWSPAKVLKRVMEGAAIRTISSSVIPISAPFRYALAAQLGPKYQPVSASHKPSSPAA
jgi:hypothetical protein